MFQDRNGGSDQGTPRGSWASFDLRNSQPDAPIAGLLDSVDADTVNKRRFKELLNAIFHAISHTHSHWQSLSSEFLHA